MAGRGELKPGDVVREFAQSADDNNGRIGEHGTVLEIHERPWGVRKMVPTARVRFHSDGTILEIEHRYLRKASAVDALGEIADE